MMSRLIERLLSSEIVRYGISGVSIAAINFGGFCLLDAAGLSYKIANLIAIVLSKTAGYFLNKCFVYKSKTNGLRETAMEALRFVLARGFTGVVDYVGVLLLVKGIQADPVLSKFALQVVVILLNYILGKIAVFRKVISN